MASIASDINQSEETRTGTKDDESLDKDMQTIINLQNNSLAMNVVTKLYGSWTNFYQKELPLKK